MKAIIIFSTKYGSVEKAALKLKSHLRGEVTVVNVKSNPQIDDYDTVILGGSIYAGRIQKSMKKFITENITKLQQKRTGLFICAGTPKESVTQGYLQKVFTKVLYDKALVRDNLGYEYDLKRFSFIDRLVVRIVGVKKSESVFFEAKIDSFAKIINSK